jgi:hypothetical protein
MPTVADVSPPKPVLPAVPARLLSSASAPTLAVASVANPGYQDCLAALSVMAANPEEDPTYQETWDSYWARVRPQRSRPYAKASRSTLQPKRDKERLPHLLLTPVGMGGGGVF